MADTMKPHSRMTGDDWLGRWQEGRTGWHEPDGNGKLKAHWPTSTEGARVLVPMCGKSPDLRWLAERGCDVTGVELSPLAVKAFFEEQRLGCTRGEIGGLPCFRADELPVALCIGDYFSFIGEKFDALYDRGALVALASDRRGDYVRHTDSLLSPAPLRLVITLEYDQQMADGPPYSVSARELQSYWPEMRRRSAHNDIDNCPPKFRAAGLREVTEVAWL